MSKNKYYQLIFPQEAPTLKADLRRYERTLTQTSAIETKLSESFSTVSLFHYKKQLKSQMVTELINGVTHCDFIPQLRDNDDFNLDALLDITTLSEEKILAIKNKWTELKTPHERKVINDKETILIADVNEDAVVKGYFANL